MDSIPVVNLQQALSTPIHIASLIVHARPDVTSVVEAWLVGQPGVEIHTQSAEGKFAVVMECEKEQAILDLLDAATEQPGVLNAALIYHEIIEDEGEAE